MTMAILRMSNFHALRMCGVREKILTTRHLILLTFVSFACIIFILGFSNGRKMALAGKPLKAIYNNSGGGRKLQLQQVITTSGESSLPVKISINNNPANQNAEENSQEFHQTTSQSKLTSKFEVKSKVIAAEEESKRKGTFEDENEFILDVHEEDIKRVRPKPMNKTMARLKAAANGLKQPPSAVQNSIFPFTSLRHSMNSLKNPMHFGAAITKMRLALELGDHEVDISNYKPLRTVSKSVQDSEDILSKHKIHLDNAPNYFLGESIPANKAKHILVITSWRSGSTFLGDILNHYPGTFYSFEPLHYLSRLYQTGDDIQTAENEIRSNLASDAVELMSNIYKCKFDKGIMGYLSHVAQPAHQFLFNHNFRLWNICRTLLPANSACFMPEFYNATCPLFPIRLMKTVRLRVPYIEDLLRDPEIGPNLKVVMLVRDPRGVMSSRSAMPWCENPQCSNPEFVCNDLQEDLVAAERLKSLHPDKMTLIRYEDLSLEPFETVDRLFKFLDLKPNKLVDHFLETHTQTQRQGTKKDESSDSIHPASEVTTTSAPNTENPYSTSRNSKLTTFAWKSKIDLQYLLRVQDLCYKPMQKLGYNLIRDQEERDNPDFPVLGKTAEDISELNFNP